MLWAYPHEFTDRRHGGPGERLAVSASPLRSAAPSHLFFLTQGYAVLDDADDADRRRSGETANDTFVEQIVASAQAAIDKAVEMGVADRDRVGVGGHSYGAFMTANLLAHSDLFRAGIARSGAYNRTLTPFGFQSERRTLLGGAGDLRAACRRSSHADKINEPILLIHGEADNNPGTFPIQCERLYQRDQGQRRHRPLRHAAARIARLRRPRIGAAHPRGDVELGERMGEERQAQDDELAAVAPIIGCFPSWS